MRTRLIISALLLAGLLFLLNWAAGRYLASVVTQQFDRVARFHTQTEYTYDRISVNPAFGSLTIRDLVFRQKDNMIEVEKITGSLTHADLWRILRKGSQDPLAQIHSFRLRLEELVAHDASEGSSGANLQDNDPFQWLFGESVMVRRAYLLYNGRMDELLQIAASRKPPIYNHRISLSLDEITFHEVIPEQLTALPIFSGYRFPDSMEQVAMQLRYRADRKTATLNSLRISAPGLYFNTSGEISFREEGWPAEPDSWNLRYTLRAATPDLARLPLPGKIGEFVMDTLSVTSDISFDHEMRDRHPLTLPGENSVYLGTVRWYPSAELIRQYGMMLGMFGLPENELPVHFIRANWVNSNDTLRVRNTSISTDPFDTRIQAIIAIPAVERATILDGSVIFTRTSAAFNDFVDGVEGLFQIELPRKNGQLHFEFHGDLQAPSLKFLEELAEPSGSEWQEE